jgi:hypothetical protein
MIKTAHLEQIIDKVSLVNDVVPNLNRGGCGIFALALAEALTAKGILAELVIASPWGTPTGTIGTQIVNELYNEYKTNNSKFTILSLHEKDISLFHVLVKVNVKADNGEYVSLLLDSEGVYESLHETDSWSNCEFEAVLNIETFRPLAESEEGWNSTYNRMMNAKVYNLVNRAVNSVIKTLEYATI